MGFSQVGAAAIVFGALAVTGFQITAQVLDVHQELEAVRVLGTQADAERLHTGLDITDVRRTGGVVTVTVRNVGSTTLDASQVDLLFNGRPATITSRTVDGDTQSVWPPETNLALRVTAPMPTDVAAVSGTGVSAFWRS